MKLWVGALVALTLFSCKGNRTLPAASPSTPVILISIDTLRADRLPAYGYTRTRTPALDALAADSVVFERAYCARLLEVHGGNITQAARAAELDRVNLLRVLDKHGLRPKR